MSLQAHGPFFFSFFAGDTYVDEIADQDHDESPEIRPDASGLEWQQW